MGNKMGTPLRLSLFLSVPVWCGFVANAMAACNNHAPTTGQTVTCDTTAPNPDPTAVIAPTGATGVTVNVGNGAQITGAATTNAGFASISVNDGSTVNNAGTIKPTTTNTTEVGVNLNGSNTTLVNASSGIINVANAPTTTGSTATTLYGVITTTATSFSNVSVKNYGTIAVTQNGTGTAYGIYPGESIDSVRIDNYGTISITRNAGTINTTRVGAIGSDDDTDEMRVVNHVGGNITASGINTFAVGARAADYTFINAGTVSTLTTNARGAIVIYGGDPDDGTSASARIVNDKKGVINGNVLITDNTPFAAGAGPGNIGAPATATTGTRDSTFNNKGTVNGAFTYGTGTHILANTGTITGPIFVRQTAALGIGGASFTLINKGTLGGDITITDRADSVNAITLNGTGFSGNVIAVNGTGNNTLTLRDVTNLTSVQNFTNLNLQRSNVTVTNGVSLVSNANIGTTIFGPGGTRAAPSTNLGSMTGTLTLAGPTTVTPVIKSLVRNGDVYQVASRVTGAGAGAVTVQQPNSALVKVSADTSDGRLLLTNQVRSANSISGLSQPAAATLGGLLTYNGHNAKVLALGGAVENLASLGAVRQAANALAPITNGADVQSIINATMLFHQQIDSRLDSFVYAQLPSTGRSADLGPSHPVPVYGVLPANGVWAEAIGGDVHQSAVAGVNGYGATLTGVVGGYDRLIIPGLRIGGAFGYIDTDVNGNANFVGARETIQTYQGLGYVAWEAPRYYLRGSAGDGAADFKSVRAINFPGFSDSAAGHHDGNVFTARGEGGIPLEYFGKLFVPYAAFTYSRLDQGAYTETSSSGAGLSYRTAHNDSDRSEVGGKVIVPLAETPIFAKILKGDSVVALEGRAAYVHEFGNVAQTVSASFAGAGNVFVATGPVPSRDMVDYSIGLRIGSPRVQIDASYNGLARSTFYQQIGLVRARYVF